MIKGVLLVLALCVCVATAADVSYFSTVDNKVKYFLELPDDDAATLTEEEKTLLTFSEEKAVYTITSTSYACGDEDAETLLYNLIVDGDPFNRNNSQHVMFEHVVGNKRVKLMSAPELCGSTINLLRKKPTICKLQAWTIFKRSAEESNYTMIVTYVPEVGAHFQGGRVIPRGRDYSPSLRMSKQQYENAISAMAQGDVSSKHTRYHGRIIAQCGTFTPEELAQPAQPLFQVGDIDYFYQQVCRLIRAAETPVPKESSSKGEWTLLIGIIVVAILLSVDWGYVRAWWCGVGDIYLANQERRKRD